MAAGRNSRLQTQNGQGIGNNTAARFDHSSTSGLSRNLGPTFQYDGWRVAREKKRQSTGTCVPLQDDDNLVGWQDLIFNKIAQGLGYKLVVADPMKKEIIDTHGQQEMVILPFLNFTRGLYDLHPTECSHYCSTLHVWCPLWRSLRLSMDWKFGGNEIESIIETNVTNKRKEGTQYSEHILVDSKSCADSEKIYEFRV